MSLISAVTISDALDAMKDSDDSIAEIDAMIPRLLKMKKQLIAQKEYIEVAINDASNTGVNEQAKVAANYAASSSGGSDGLGAKIVDFRVKLYKHRESIERVTSGAANDGVLNDTEADAPAASPPTGPKFRAQHRRGGRGSIFKSDQVLDFTTGVALEKTGAEGALNRHQCVDLTCAKKFLISINTILTQPNDVSSIGTTAAAAVSPTGTGGHGTGGKSGGRVIGYKTAFATDGAVATDYEPGAKHIISNGTLRGLLMQGSKGETAMDPSDTLVIGTIGTPVTLGGSDVQLEVIRGFGL